MEILRTSVLVVTGALTTATENQSQDHETIPQTDPFPVQHKGVSHTHQFLDLTFYFKAGIPFPFILICLPVGTWRSSEPSEKKDSNGIREERVNKSTKRNRKRRQNRQLHGKNTVNTHGKVTGLAFSKAITWSLRGKLCFYFLLTLTGKISWKLWME